MVVALVLMAILANILLVTFAYNGPGGQTLNLSGKGADPSTMDSWKDQSGPVLEDGEVWADKTVQYARPNDGEFTVTLSALAREKALYEEAAENLIVLMIDWSGSVVDFNTACHTAEGVLDTIYADRPESRILMVSYGTNNVTSPVFSDSVSAKDYLNTFIKANKPTVEKDSGTNIQGAIFAAEQALKLHMAASGERLVPSYVLITDGVPTYAYRYVLNESVTPDVGLRMGDGHTPHTAFYGQPLFSFQTILQANASKKALPGSLFFTFRSPGDNSSSASATLGAALPNEDLLYIHDGKYEVQKLIPGTNPEEWEEYTNVSNPFVNMFHAFTDEQTFTEPYFVEVDRYVGGQYRTGYWVYPTFIEESLPQNYTPYADIAAGLNVNPADTGLTSMLAQQRVVRNGVIKPLRAETDMVITDVLGETFTLDAQALTAAAAAQAPGTSVAYDETTRTVTWTIPAALVPLLPCTEDYQEPSNVAPLRLSYDILFSPAAGQLDNWSEGMRYYTNARTMLAGVESNPNLATFAPNLLAGRYVNETETILLPNRGWVELTVRTPPTSSGRTSTTPSDPTSFSPPPSDEFTTPSIPIDFPVSPSPSDDGFEDTSIPIDPPIPPTGGVNSALFMLFGGIALVGCGLLLGRKVGGNVSQD